MCICCMYKKHMPEVYQRCQLPKTKISELGNVMVQFSLVQNITNFHTTILEMWVSLHSMKKIFSSTRMSVDASAITRWSPVQSQAHARWRFWCVQCTNVIYTRTIKNCMVRPETIRALASTLCLCYWPTTVHNSQFREFHDLSSETMRGRTISWDSRKIRESWHVWYIVVCGMPCTGWTTF